jgi:Undecaprenyl-phosphate glucose phosphotransferase
VAGTIDDSRRVFASLHSTAGRRSAGSNGSRLLRRTRPTELTMILFAMASIECVCMAATAFLAALAYHFFSHTPLDFVPRYIMASLFLGAADACIAARLGQLAHVQKQRRIRFAWSGLGSIAATFLLVTSLLFIFKLSDFYSRGTLILQFLSCSIVVFAVRLGMYNGFQAAAAAGLVRRLRVVLIGNRNDCAQYARQLRKSGGGIHVVFCPIAWHAEAGTTDTMARLLPSRVVEQCRSMEPDSIIMLVDKEHDDETASALAAGLRDIPADVYAVPTHRPKFWTAARPAEIGGIPGFGLSRRPLSIVDLAIKRIFDIVAATAGLVILSPLLLFASAAVVLDSRGPVFFVQIRHGYNNQSIRVLKFRTMYVSEQGEFRQASKGDARITPMGRLFRITGIDELPQLWNILCGEMSAVGPRPHAIQHNELFTPRIESFYRRHTVKPGLTGWAQVNGLRGETDTLEKMQKRIEYDLFYIDNWSLLFDLKIIILTLFSGKTYTNAH